MFRGGDTNIYAKDTGAIVCFEQRHPSHEARLFMFRGCGQKTYTNDSGATEFLE